MQFRLTKRYAVYLDWTLETTPRVFYVGEGNQRRVNNFKRNRVWFGLIKRFGMRREIIKEFDVLSEARDYETSLIIQHRTFAPETGWGANLKLRDPAPNGIVQSPESNRKRSLAMKGRPKKPFTEEHKRNISLSHRGIVWSPEAIAARSRGLKGKPFSASHKEGLKKMWKRDDYRKRVTDSVRATYSRKRFRRQASAWFRRSSSGLLLPPADNPT